MKLLLMILAFCLTLDAKHITIASYNVLNLFDGEYDGSEYRDFSKKRWTQKEYEEKLKKIVKVIKDIDADIIGLQEIENSNVLDELRETLGYRYSATMKKDNSAITIGLLSNLPITQVETLDVKHQRRGILKVTVDIDSEDLVLYINHWKSLNSPEKHRIAYAKALIKDILTLKNEYIILGDLNSEYNRYIYLKGKTAINHILKTTQNGALVNKESIKENQHYNLWLELPYQDRFSYLYKGRKSTLDAFVIPYQMFDGRGVDYVDASFEVFKPNYLYKNSKIDRSYSDHLPLKAEFSTDAYKISKKAHTELYTVDELKNTKKLQKSVLLKNVVVIHKDKYGFVIKDSSGAIYIYAPKSNLDLGQIYDLEVLETGQYHGLMQIKAFDIVRLSKKTDREKLMLKVDSQNLNRPEYLNEVVSSIKGVYKNNKLHYSGGSINLYFRDKSKRVKQGKRIEIKDARVSLYKSNPQLIISKNTEVNEK
ncbi:MAG: endonuclease/exonuclease/phosphatase family protein [Campylobacterales bacterium]